MIISLCERCNERARVTCYETEWLCDQCGWDKECAEADELAELAQAAE